MKRIFLLLIAAFMVLSLTACGGKETPQESSAPESLQQESSTPESLAPESESAPQEDETPGQTEEEQSAVEPAVKLALGETAATDLAEFTLEKCSLTYYVSNESTNYVEPTDKPNNLFAASLGHCYVSLTFTLANKDRGGSISFADTFGEWNPDLTVSYGGEDYHVKGFNLNDNAGDYYFRLDFSAVIDRDSGKILNKHNSSNYLLIAGETVTLRSFGIIDVEPDALTDGFEIKVGVPNVGGGYEYFTYTVPDSSK